MAEETEKKIEEKKEEKKPKVAEQPKTDAKRKTEKIEATKKTEAVVKGRNLGISTKHSVAICRLIRGKQVDKAMSLLTEVERMKRAVPMKGELPHRKGRGMERGRYPVNASKQFIKLLKQLVANASVNELDLEKGRIECKADRASRPYKRFGDMKFKRTNVFLKLKIPGLKEENKKKSKEK